jgi:hypothetical protein
VGLAFAIAVGSIIFPTLQYFLFQGKVWLPLILFFIAIEISEKKQKKKYAQKIRILHIIPNLNPGERNICYEY